MPKKLIETLLPLNALNAANAYERTHMHKHPNNLHLYWTRKPLVTFRSMLLAQLVDDPSEHPELFPSVAEQNAERTRLLSLMEELMDWEKNNDDDLFTRAHEEIIKNTHGRVPRILDPFCGGGYPCRGPKIRA